MQLKHSVFVQQFFFINTFTVIRIPSCIKNFHISSLAEEFEPTPSAITTPNDHSPAVVTSPHLLCSQLILHNKAHSSIFECFAISPNSDSKGSLSLVVRMLYPGKVLSVKQNQDVHCMTQVFPGQLKHYSLHSRLLLEHALRYRSDHIDITAQFDKSWRLVSDQSFCFSTSTKQCNGSSGI